MEGSFPNGGTYEPLVRKFLLYILKVRLTGFIRWGKNRKNLLAGNAWEMSKMHGKYRVQWKEHEKRVKVKILVKVQKWKTKNNLVGGDSF